MLMPITQIHFTPLGSSLYYQPYSSASFLGPSWSPIQRAAAHCPKCHPRLCLWSSRKSQIPSFHGNFGFLVWPGLMQFLSQSVAAPANLWAVHSADAVCVAQAMVLTSGGLGLNAKQKASSSGAWTFFVLHPARGFDLQFRTDGISFWCFWTKAMDYVRFVWWNLYSSGESNTYRKGSRARGILLEDVRQLLLSVLRYQS